MVLKLAWYGHAGAAGSVIGDKPMAAEAGDNMAADFIIVSHGHGDHVGDTVAIAKRTGAMVISNHEICTWLN